MIFLSFQAECVRWIKRTKVTEDNCMAMIKLSSLYDFTISSYEEYIEAHLPEMMLKDELLDITPESVRHLLQDPRLSYAGIQDKFSFLVRWTKSQLRRNGEFENILQSLNFEDSDADFIQNIVLREPLVHQLCNPSFIAELSSINVLSAHDIILFPQLYQDCKLQCFDITRQRWCSINVDVVEPVPNGFYKEMVQNIEGVQGKLHSNVYMVKSSYGGRSIYIFNLETRVVKKSNITITTGIGDNKLSQVEQYIHDQELVLVSKELVDYGKVNSLDVSEISPDLLQLFMFSRNPIERMIASTEINSRLARKMFSISVLYIGQIEDETTELTPILSLRKEISKICSNGSIIAMLSINAEDLYLFNKVDFSLDVVSIKNTYNSINSNMSMLSTSGEGFVIYDQERAVHVARQIGPSLSCNWLISVSSFCSIKDKERNIEKYTSCENKWYCYLRNYRESPVFSYTSHEKLTANQSLEAGNNGRQGEIWEPMPTHPSGYMSPPSKIFQITLPIRRLLCALSCPHCKKKMENERNYSYNDHYEDSDDDDDDDDDMYGYSRRVIYPDYDYYDYDDYYYDSD